jgi:hypothetical protein
MPREKDVVAAEIAAKHECDVVFFNGGLERPCDDALIQECMNRGKNGRRKNALLIMVTYGGDPDAAYRIARCMQRSYERLSIFVAGPCKSAGTLLAIGAHELIISDHGELGPLDIQMAKKDEFFDRQSGLTVMTALQALEERAYIAAETMLLKIEAATAGVLSVQTATTLAAELVVGMYAPIASQIDPMHVGDASRQLLIAERYGQRLARQSGNLKPGALLKMYTQFPSHGFVIDRDEAKEYFANVREPTKLELELIESIGLYGRRVRPQRQIAVNPVEVVKFLTPPVSVGKGAHHGTTPHQSNREPKPVSRRNSARPSTSAPTADTRRTYRGNGDARSSSDG